ncbi:GntR family transcriptional regulator [Microbispora bryophytorum]|uniref:GntR family transcriptional regulator n=1 Tax=Microbispora bryophytorum TaxID=1460882 RepID=A0A8H9GZ16_9ACTN|nr:GntR family transcriptional regulator [Microbispora bryophytorum]MBD3137172.1 GntR family transcriptional regulator [Microbispora bryophytorum]TQS06649.1 GntR family transcriptional regulator [Microbispora bryophytorum]GGO07248.1 GntR family transcriptional regulator [Microbispora bryophytorum]
MVIVNRLDPTSGVPLYLQVERSLQQRVDVGEWVPGERLPTEEELGKAYGVSRVTVRQAVARLVDRGVLVREQGRGTFVRDTSLTAGARWVTSFTAELAQLGHSAGSRVLGQTVVTAGEEDLPPEMQLPADARMLRLRRLRTDGSRPVGVQTALLPLDRFPGLADIDFTDRSLYRTLNERYGLVPREAVETFTVGGVLDEDATTLGVAPGAHAFYVERLTFDAHGPFEHVRSVMRGDRYRVRLALRTS